MVVVGVVDSAAAAAVSIETLLVGSCAPPVTRRRVVRRTVWILLWLWSGGRRSLGRRTTDVRTRDESFGRGSKIRVGDQFIVLGERGTLALVNIDNEKLDEVARASYKQIHYPAWTAPVLSRKRLYLRCEDALICLDLAPSDSKSESQN